MIRKFYNCLKIDFFVYLLHFLLGFSKNFPLLVSKRAMIGTTNITLIMLIVAGRLIVCYLSVIRLTDHNSQSSSFTLTKQLLYTVKTFYNNESLHFSVSRLFIGYWCKRNLMDHGQSINEFHLGLLILRGKDFVGC